MKLLGTAFLFLFLFTVSPHSHAAKPWQVTCNQLKSGSATREQFQTLVKFATEHFMNQSYRDAAYENKKGEENVDYFLPQDFMDASEIWVSSKSDEGYGDMGGAYFYFLETPYEVKRKDGSIEHYSIEMEVDQSEHDVLFNTVRDKQTKKDYCGLYYLPLYVRMNDLQTGKTFVMYKPSWLGDGPVVDVTSIIEKW